MKDYGATGDGKTDDAAAITRAIETLPATGGTVFFPPGTYFLKSAIPNHRRSHIVFKGTDFWTTIIKSDVVGLAMFQPAGDGQKPATDLSFEGLGFEMSGGVAITLMGDSTNGAISIRNCRFWNDGQLTNAVIYVDGITNLIIADCLFHSPGKANYDAILIRGASKNIRIRDNRFLYFHAGVIILAGEVKPETPPAEDITMEKNYFDGGWWTLKEDFQGEAATVSYTANSLTDDKGDFRGMDIGATVRAMPKLRTGSGVYDAGTLKDTSADFVKAGVRRGCLVYSGTTMGIVSQVTSPPSLVVEEWLSIARNRI